MTGDKSNVKDKQPKSTAVESNKRAKKKGYVVVVVVVVLLFTTAVGLDCFPFTFDLSPVIDTLELLNAP